MKRIRFTIILLSFIPTLLNAGEIVKGKACYRFSDQDSIQAARDIALSMAKREALEGYSVFVESTSTVQNSTLKNDLISSLSVAVLRKMKIVQQKEDLANRKICTEISAEIEPFEIKQRVTATINRFRRQNMNIQTGLPETKWGKVLKAEERGEKLRVVVECKKEKKDYSDLNDYNKTIYIRITHYDTDGIPDKQDSDAHSCFSKGQILVYNLELPTYKNFTYSFEFLE